jgi:phenylalanyl-tRNA synthetase alpha chain
LAVLSLNPEGLDSEIINELKKRRLAASSTLTYFIVERGPKFSTNPVKLETELTEDLLLNKEYTRRNFKPYNFDALGPQVHGGHLHPLQKV